MKQITSYIQEGLRINKDTASKFKQNKYTEHPDTKDELREILKERLKKDKDADLNDIDVSNITDMVKLFSQLKPGNIKIDQWDVSNVEDMSYMFLNCNSMNADLSKWNVSNVKWMSCMFYNCHKFNSDLSKWDVSKVNGMYGMFYGCKSLKTLPSWY